MAKILDQILQPLAKIMEPLHLEEFLFLISLFHNKQRTYRDGTKQFLFNGWEFWLDKIQCN